MHNFLVCVCVGGSQLKDSLVGDAAASYLRAGDCSNYLQVRSTNILFWWGGLSQVFVGALGRSWDGVV